MRRLINYFTRRANASYLGKKVSVKWDRSTREGIIDYISPDGGFSINFGNATMVVPAMIHGYRKNPFKNVNLI